MVRSSNKKFLLRAAAVVSTGLTVSALAIAPASAAGDVSISFTDNTYDTCDLNGSLGETFTAPASGEITSVSLAPAGPAVARTLRVVASNLSTVLSTQQVTVAESTSLVSFALPSPLAVTAGQVYGIDLSGTCAAGIGLFGTSTNGYAGGHAYGAQTPVFGNDVAFGVVIHDDISPSVTVAAAAGQANPSHPSNGPIHFSVTFSEAVTGFTNSDVTLQGAGATGAGVAVSGSGTTYDVTITPPSSGSTSGPVTVSVPAAAALDPRNNPSLASNQATVQYLAPQPQTIAFTSTPASPAPRTSTYQAIATGGGSGNTVTFGTSTSGVCTVSASGATTFDHAGTCTITANQIGNSDYTAAAQATQNVTVAKTAQTVTFTSTPPTGAAAGGTPYQVVVTGGASGQPIEITAAPTAVCQASPTGAGQATVSFVGVGTCAVGASQAGNSDYAAATSITQNVAVGVAPDTTAPDTSFVKGPKRQTHKRKAVFRFSSTEAASHFECSIDGKAFGACTGPVKKTFKPGRHTFAVRAIDASGNVDATPAVVRWKFVPIG